MRAPEAAGRWIVTIPNWRPHLLNELKGHPMKIARLKAQDALRLMDELHLAGVPRADVPPCERAARRKHGLPRTLPSDPIPTARRVTLCIVGPFRRLPDSDAPLKSFLDALVQAGHLVDDGEAWCEWTPPTFERAPSLLTAITLEDLP